LIVALLRTRAKVECRIDHLQDLGMRKATEDDENPISKPDGRHRANISRLDVLCALGQPAHLEQAA
jgi:hypothetical protein